MISNYKKLGKCSKQTICYAYLKSELGGNHSAKELKCGPLSTSKAGCSIQQNSQITWKPTGNLYN